MRQKIAIGLLIGVCVGVANVHADVHLAPVFGDNMVLQRDVPAKLVGWADVGETVTVKLGERVVAQVVGEGKDKSWTVLLPAQKAGTLPDIIVSGKNRVALTNLLAGDVWICSGQSNMHMSLQRGTWCGYGGVLNADQEVAAAGHPTIRLMKSPGGNWEACSPDSAKSFSAAGYFFGRELNQRLNVPIGLIEAAVGGTMAELWVPRVMREGTSEFAAEMAEAKRTQEELKNLVKGTWNEQDRLRAAQSTQGTGQLYTRMIAPLTSLSIKGAIWYQGESNTRKASAYEHVMSLLIQGWRKEWGMGDFPFLVMQLVNFNFKDEPWQGKATFAALREAQQALADHVPNTGMAVGIDIGEANNIHPRNKQEVGRRLALVALKQVYKQDVIAAGPAVTDARFEPGRVTLVFDPGGKDQSLVFKNSATNGFELAGSDGKFGPATAQVNGNTIVLTTAEITAPCAVRYAWADNPPATVFNTAGLPTAPFRKTAPAVSVDDLTGKRVLVLGDSITAAGTYVTFIEYYLKKRYPAKKFELINSGRCSETTSGLSEAGHPGIRPCVHKRLASEIAKHKPQIIIACYGMNDGIYASASEERAKAYYDGMLKLVKDSQAQGVEKVILLTPPVFDPRPWSTRLSKEGEAPLMNHPYEKYDDVLAGYAKWIMGLKLDGVSSIDLHTPMKNEIAVRRQKKPEFKLSPDGIHPGPLGHLVMAHAVLIGLGVDMRVEDLDAELAKVQADLVAHATDGQSPGGINIDTPEFKFKGAVTKDFDLSKSPKDWIKTQPIINAMLELGEKHVYKEIGNVKLPFWLFRPEGMEKNETRPCVMFIHGGSWGGNAPMFAPQCLYLSRIGIIGVTVEFRRYDEKAGISPKTCLADCRSAYRWLRKNGKQLGIDTDKIMLSGESAGGHLSLSMVTLDGYDDPADDKSIPIDPKALILFDPAIDLIDGWKGGQERLKPFNIDPKTFSPAHHVRPGMPETLVISGSKDGVIPPDLIRAFVKRMEEKGNKATFIEYPGMGHAVFNYGFTGVGSEYFLKGMGHVEELLKKFGYLPVQAR